MIDYCKTKGKKWFNQVVDSPFIDSAIRSAFGENTEIVQIESIPVAISEWDYIQSLDVNDLHKKLLFGMLVHSKLKSYAIKIQGKKDLGYYFGGGGKHSYKSLLDTLNDKYTRTFLDKEIHKIIGQFKRKGLTKSTYTASVKLLFVDEIIQDGEIKFNIKDFETIGLRYELELGNPKVKHCEDCRVKLVKVVGKFKFYCKRCGDERERIRKQNEYNESKSKISEF
mgnify:CR=1 FL=1